MRVVVDTNVFISALLKEKSVPAMAIQLVQQRDILLKSTATESELFAVLDRPHIAKLLEPHVRIWLPKLFATAEFVTTTEHIAVCRDAKDDKFLDLAINGRADLVVSGDNDLLTLKMFRGIPIISPAAFVKTAIR